VNDWNEIIVDDERFAQIARNVERDPNYRPYCMRCPGLIRMRRIEHMLWTCNCGAIHDQRSK